MPAEMYVGLDARSSAGWNRPRGSDTTNAAAIPQVSARAEFRARCCFLPTAQLLARERARMQGRVASRRERPYRALAESDGSPHQSADNEGRRTPPTGTGRTRSSEARWNDGAKTGSRANTSTEPSARITKKTKVT
jgi:hypothetical protein